MTRVVVVVVGAGMVAHRFVESVLSRAEGAKHITVLGDEGRHPYDRVGLTGYFSGSTPDDLTLDRAIFDDGRVALVSGDRVVRIDRRTQTVVTHARRAIEYDTLVLATGSYAARVAVDGSDPPGCFVYRTLEDVQELRRFVQQRSAELGRPLRGAVFGGGLLGLEAAGALQERWGSISSLRRCRESGSQCSITALAQTDWTRCCAAQARMSQASRSIVGARRQTQRSWSARSRTRRMERSMRCCSRRRLGLRSGSARPID